MEFLGLEAAYGGLSVAGGHGSSGSSAVGQSQIDAQLQRREQLEEQYAALADAQAAAEAASRPSGSNIPPPAVYPTPSGAFVWGERHRHRPNHPHSRIPPTPSRTPARCSKVDSRPSRPSPPRRRLL